MASVKKANSVHQRIIWSCSWHESGDYFATCSRDAKVALWKVNGEDVQLLGEAHKAENAVTAVALAPTKSLTVAIGLESGSIKLLTYSEDGWKKECEAKAHHEAVKRLKFQRNRDDEVTLASCSLDHSVKLFLTQ